MKINKKYKYFALLPSIKKIVNGWEIISDVEELKYYAKMDMEDMDYKKSDYKILSGSALKRMGIDPYLNSNWATLEERIKYHNSKMGNLKKGSKAAKDFMAKLRAKKSIGAVKKKKAAKKAPKKAAKKNTLSQKLKASLRKKKLMLPHGYQLRKRKIAGLEQHKDVKSHNYHITISGVPKGDVDAMVEISLYADNDSQLYFSNKLPILKNLSKKYKKGTFDLEKSAKLWRYYVENAMKKYAKEFGGKWNTLLSVNDRKLLAMEYAKQALFEFELGNFTE